jgi:hypothetical protein
MQTKHLRISNKCERNYKATRFGRSGFFVCKVLGLCKTNKCEGFLNTGNTFNEQHRCVASTSSALPMAAGGSLQESFEGSSAFSKLLKKGRKVKAKQVFLTTLKINNGLDHFCCRHCTLAFGHVWHV